MSKETITNTPLQIIKELQIKVNDLSDEVARLTARAEAAEVEISSIYAMPLFFYDSPRPPLVVFLTKKFNEIFTNRDKWKKRAKLFREAYKDKDVEAFNLGWHKTAIENCLSEAKEEGQQLRQSLAALEADRDDWKNAMLRQSVDLKQAEIARDKASNGLAALEAENERVKEEVTFITERHDSRYDDLRVMTNSRYAEKERADIAERKVAALTLELEAARAKATGNGWMPIETAPTGEPILLLWVDGHIQLETLKDEPAFWYETAPISWQPLPALPAADEKQPQVEEAAADEQS